MRTLFSELKAFKGFYFLIIFIPIVSILAAVGNVQYGIMEQHSRYETHLNYGYASIEAQAYDEAITAFEDAYRIDPTYDAAIGLAKAWYGSGDAEKAIQVLNARAGLYESTDEIEALLTEYKISLGIYPTVIIGGKEIDTSSTTIFIKDVTLTEEDKQALSEFTELVTLDLTNCGLTDIAFLQGCSKLMSVTLTENPISDFTPLHGKPDLRTLYINDTAITDWSQLHAISSLSLLNANGNWITAEDDAALNAALPDCEIYAGLNGYLIYDITIAGTTYSSDVTELDLSGAGLSDVTVIPQFSAVRKLNLSGNRISWITPFDGMNWVSELDLSGNRISNISSLSSMTALTVLNLNENAVTDLSPLAGKTNLTELHLNGNPIYHGHDALSTLTGLQKLSLQDALVKDQHLSLLPMESLTELDLRNNKQLTADAVLNLANSYPNCKILSDFGPAEVTLGSKSFPATESVVDASYSSVIDLSTVTDFTGLTSLNLAGNGVSDFTPLKNMTALTELNLQATGFSDCAILSTLTNLTALTLTGNPAVTDIAPLVSCTKLSTLYLDETGVTDVSALKSLTALTNLHLDKCAIADFSQLYELTSLKTLYILDCGITADALTALQQALPDCTIYAGDVADVTPAA